MADGSLLSQPCDKPVSSPWSGRKVHTCLPHGLCLEFAYVDRPAVLTQRSMQFWVAPQHSFPGFSGILQRNPVFSPSESEKLSEESMIGTMLEEI